MVVGEMTEHYDVAVVGSGPAGYVAAIRAGQLGKNVVLIEKESHGVGGLCLHHGCIPSKALIHTANVFWDCTHSKDQGITVSLATLDMEKTQVFKQGVVDTLTRGIEILLEKASVEVVYGKATFVKSNELRIEMDHDTMGVTADTIILATGGKENSLATLPFDEKTILSSTGILNVERVPASLAIAGSGYIAMEMAHTFQKFGSSVTIIHRSPAILQNMDARVGDVMQRQLEAMGVTFWKNTEILSGEKNAKGIDLHLQTKEGVKQTVSFESVLVAVGRSPLTASLGLENTKVTFDEKGHVVVNEKCQTSDPHIMAIGDISGEPYLAHRAVYMGKIAAEVCAGLPSAYDAQVIPGVIYSDPEIAWVGLQEPEAIKQGRSIITGSFPFSASGRSLGANRPHGFAKIIADPLSHHVLGGLIVGSHASDMVSEIAFAVEMEAKLEDIAGTIHPHPTYSEAILESAEDALDKCVHVPMKKKK